MKTKAEYIESMRKMNFELYMFGEQVTDLVDNPIIKPTMNCVAATYELAEKPELEKAMTATSHLTGKKDKPLLPHSPEHRRPGEQIKNGEAIGSLYWLLLSALRWYGYLECSINSNL